MQAGRTSRQGGRLVCATFSSLCLWGSLFLLGLCLLKPQPQGRERKDSWGMHSEHAQPKPSLASLKQDNVDKVAIHSPLIESTSSVLLCCIYFVSFLRQLSWELAAAPHPHPTASVSRMLGSATAGGHAIHEMRKRKNGA